MTVTDAEIAFYESVVENPTGHTLSDLRYAFYIGVLSGEIVLGGEVSPEDIEAAVDEYLSENPPSGVAAGGSTGQALVKKTGTDFDTEWGSVVPASTTLTNPGSESIAAWTIQDDGSSTDSWPDRLRIVFDPLSGADRPTFWLNEYGETRGMPAKNATVAARFFGALDSAGYAERSDSVPIFEIADFRDGARSTIFGVSKGGRVTQGGQPVGTVFTLESSDDEGDVPATLPPGTLIVRKL